VREYFLSLVRGEAERGNVELDITLEMVEAAPKMSDGLTILHDTLAEDIRILGYSVDNVNGLDTDTVLLADDDFPLRISWEGYICWPSERTTTCALVRGLPSAQELRAAATAAREKVSRGYTKAICDDLMAAAKSTGNDGFKTYDHTAPLPCWEAHLTSEEKRLGFFVHERDIQKNLQALGYAVSWKHDNAAPRVRGNVPAGPGNMSQHPKVRISWRL
jgi:hypothetical protein